MRAVFIEKGLEDWRGKARQLLAERVHPREVMWMREDGGASLFSAEREEMVSVQSPDQSSFRVPKSFVSLAEAVACHRSGRQWSLLYGVLWRLAMEKKRRLLDNKADTAIRELELLSSEIRRDIHKMRAFVRFRQVDTLPSGREVYVAWYEPDHLIVRLNSSFFQKRFAGMDWSILTPDECVHWNGKRISYTPGVERDQAPDGDELEDLWRAYYRSTFNPARVKIKMMQSEMPKKFWKNLPEAEIIQQLIDESGSRVQGMMQEAERPLKPEPRNAYLKKLREMGE